MTSGNTQPSKIGILTFHRTNNFGSELQAFGLYRAIKDMGYPCEIIDYRCPAIEYREFERPRAKMTSLKGVLKAMLLQPTLDAKAHYLEKFLQDHAELSCPYTPENISRSNEVYGKFIVGSDIVWGVDITESDYNYFLDFVRDSYKKFAFSSSVGNSHLAVDEEKVSALLKEFSEICVRERDAVKWVRQLSNRDASLVCDPTMLLTADEWKKHIPPTRSKEKYVLLYFNSDDGKCMRDAIEYAKRHQLKLYLLDYGRPQWGRSKVRPKSLNEFLGLILGAEAVFSASYHGILFSLYFERELFFYTRSHRERMISLAEKLSFMERCCDACSPEDVKPIDYNRINSEIAKFRQESLNHLKRILEK